MTGIVFTAKQNFPRVLVYGIPVGIFNECYYIYKVQSEASYQLKLIGNLKLSCLQEKHQCLKINHTFSFDLPNLNKPLAKFLFMSQF